ncbi:MAG: acyl transferase [Moraxellaceae bacterium]|nr:MAG: acyl transferase [Moraxellaceae bacterium]
MTILGRLMSFFPLLNLTLVIIAFFNFVFDPSAMTALLVPVSAYAFPLVCFHIHQYRFPLKEGLSSISRGYSPWYGSHMIQNMFLTFPAFERFLRFIPGAFSAWLRLWGSEIGSGVHWTSQFELSDRGLLVIGDNCVFGYDVRMTSHAVTPSAKHGMKVYVKRIRIEDNAFVGATSRIGPGVVVEEGALVGAVSDLFPNKIVRKNDHRKKKVAAS